MVSNILTPAVVIDLDIAEKNIRDMLDITKAYGILHRPHIKAHKSVFFARKQVDAGCVGITCAKLSEAEVMADHGFTDILIAFPIIGELKLDRLGKLLEKADVSTIINSVQGAEGLSRLGERLGRKINVFIELDGGINRGGLIFGQPALDFALKVKGLQGIHICGLMYYGGTIYGEATQEGLISKTKQELEHLTYTRDLLNANGFDIRILSTGSSLSARLAEHLEGVTEVRAGNYIFNDGASLWQGLVTEEDCALRVLSTVVSKPDENTLIIDAGSKTLTSDTGAFTKGFGWVVGEGKEIEIYKLNEEHGFLRTQKPNDYQVGDVLEIIPNHACVICNLTDSVYGVRGNEVEAVIPIEARGKNI